MGNILSYIKNNKVLLILICILLVIIAAIKQKQQPISLFNSSYSTGSRSSGMTAPSAGMPYDQKFAEIAPVVDSYAPQPQVSNRLVVQNSYLSLLVKNVKSVRDEILQYVQQKGGYMVSSDTTGDQETPSVNMTVRVPASDIDATLEKFRTLSIRVVSEHLEGQDVTDQFVDIQKRISILEKTMLEFEALRDKSKEISDLSNITQQILNIQSQIDNYKGQQESLEKNAQFAKITIYLSTDEIALPYQPDDNFRPDVIFKLAFRSVITSLRSVATTVIWIAVYGIIWIPLFIAGTVLFVYLHRKRK